MLRFIASAGRSTSRFGTSHPWRTVAAVVAVLATIGPARAGDIHSFNVVEYKFLEHGRVAWFAGGGLRFRDGLGDAYDRRVYGGAEIDLGRGIEASLFHLFRYREVDGNRLEPNQRTTVSLEYPIRQARWAILGGTLYERHFTEPPSPDFNRYRQQFEIEQPDAASAPWLSTDFAFRHEGLVRSRNRVGWRWRTSGGHEISLAYQFESIRQGRAWAPRHAVFTEFEFTRPTYAKRARR